MTSLLRRSFRNGFTLIEMLVVVAVILLLAGAIYPALSRAKEWGRATKCLSNLKQLQVATMNYTTDSGRLPLAYDDWYQQLDGSWRLSHGWVGGYTWPGYPKTTSSPGGKPGVSSYNWRGAQGLQCLTNGVLWSYLQKEPSVYLCPTFAQRTVCKQTDAMRSYSMNVAMHGRLFADQSIQASRSVLYGEDGALLLGQAPAQVDGQFTTNELGRWHGPRGHVIYVDGHTDRW